MELSNMKPYVLEWLYKPALDFSIDKIIMYIDNNNIPQLNEITIIKYIKLLYQHKFTREEIIKYLNKINNFKIIITDDLIDKIKDEIPDMLHQFASLRCIFNPDFNICDIFKFNIKHTVVPITKPKQKIKDGKHDDYPLVDPIFGRPHIELKKCCHKDCGQIFETEGQLTHHLYINGCYMYRFHKAHEETSLINNLTPEKVLQENIVCCPSYICDKCHFDTPNDLILHLRSLGIKPFWMPNTQDYPPTENNFGKKIIRVKKLVFRRDTCVICLSKEPDLVFIPCMHSNICFICYKELNKTGQMKCPECCCVVTNFLPY
jgi:hypothetical protein